MIARFVSAAIVFGFAVALVGTPVPRARAEAATTWPGVPVLMYHKIDAQVPTSPVGRDLTVEPAAFEAQLRYLRARGISTITASELAHDVARGVRPERVVVLTFDDGYEDAATVALPLLRKYGARGTFFVSSGFVGTPRHLTWSEMRAMRAAGMEVACHGTFHLDLSTLDRARQMAEAGGCMRRFAHYLGGAPPDTYAYPAGKFDAVTLEIMKKLGIAAAFTERPGLVTSLAQPYALPRRRIRHDDGVERFGELATP
jgi:peptidoglycan/xylan/chitin deacetylase (PgdA/CDA1 family)